MITLTAVSLNSHHAHFLGGLPVELYPRMPRLEPWLGKYPKTHLVLPSRDCVRVRGTLASAQPFRLVFGRPTTLPVVGLPFTRASNSMPWSKFERPRSNEAAPPPSQLPVAARLTAGIWHSEDALSGSATGFMAGKQTI